MLEFGVGDGVTKFAMSNFLQEGRRSGALMICLTGACLTSLPQAFVSEHGQFLALRFALGLFIGGILPTADTLVGRIVPSSQRGLSYGLTASALHGQRPGPAFRRVACHPR